VPGDAPPVQILWTKLHQPTVAPDIVRRESLLSRLDDRWADRLGGLSLVPWTAEDGTQTTELAGRVTDQAALAGVLDSLHGLHLPVLAVECLGRSPDTPDLSGPDSKERRT